MDETTIEPGQAAKIYHAIFPHINYLCRLQERMMKARFPPDDTLMVLVSRAYDAVRALYGKLHYLSCVSGVGRPAKGDGEKQED